MINRERRQAAIPILVFGLEVVELFYSRQFQDREEALIRIRNVLKQNEEPDFGYNKIARATSLILHRGLREPVFSGNSNLLF